jgi:hypothetical protein
MNCQGKANLFLGHCERKPTVERDGKWFCWQHDPERLKRLAAERWAKRKEEIARTESEQDARIHRRRLLERAGIDNPSDDLLERIIALGGIQNMVARLEDRQDDR